MLSAPFYHQLFRKYIIIFGTLFNNIKIDRTLQSGSKQTILVPIAYGPRDKFLARVDDNPTAISQVSTILPRIGFEIENLRYAPDRKLNTIGKKVSKNNLNGNSVYKRVYNPVPYDLNFTMSILTKTNEDATKIVEQILPYFTPEWTVTAKLLEDFDDVTDIPLVLNSVTAQDTYDAAFTTRRAIIYTLKFTMKCYFYGPVNEAKLIKISKVNFYTPEYKKPYTGDYTNEVASRVTIQPGLTANGNPTTDITETVSYTQIDEEDNWDFIVTIEDFPNANT